MMESETVALSHAAKEALWLRQLCHARTKHFDMPQHFIREVVAKGELSVGYIPGSENPADIFMKSLDRSKHAIALGLLHMA